MKPDRIILYIIYMQNKMLRVHKEIYSVPEQKNHKSLLKEILYSSLTQKKSIHKNSIFLWVENKKILSCNRNGFFIIKAKQFCFFFQPPFMY